jgi:hypothetical protein
MFQYFPSFSGVKVIWQMQSLMPIYQLPKPKFFGSAEKVADQILHWYEACSMDDTVKSHTEYKGALVQKELSTKEKKPHSQLD